MKIQCSNCFEDYDYSLDMCPHCGYVKGEHAEKDVHMNPGTVLQNRYRIGRVLGYGGFGVTYLAWDDVLATKVAIKEYLPSEFSTRTDGEMKVTVFTDGGEKQYYAGLHKFLEEAKRLARFQGEPGIVGVFNSFKENNTAYIVMEYLEGETLKKFLKRSGVMPVDSAIGLLTPVIQSLKSVHSAGIIHRDIAPDNIMITKTGEVKLLDFGAARYAAAPKKTIIVKSGFSPLEQYQSKKEQGTYTDVFALASVLYYMITGVTPSDAPDRRASIEMGKKDSLKAPSVYVNDIEPNVENALLNAMNLNISDRTADMDTFFTELTSEGNVKRRVGSIKRKDALKWPLWAKIVIPVGAIAVAAALVLLFTGKLRFDSGLQNDISIPDGMVRVPSVVNDDTETAKERLEKADLLYMISGKSYSQTIPSDYVLTQDKTGGTVVMENTVVNVTVSKGVETSFVDDVILLTKEEATAILEDAGFDVEINTEHSRAVAEGSVISQSEEKDTELEVGSTVTLTVSSGADESDEDAENTAVPDFSGLTYDEALTKAENAGVVLSVTKRSYTDEAEADTVLSQSVDAGEEVAVGTEIELTASLGEEYVRTVDVQYQTEEEAAEDLEGLDVQVEYEESTTVKEGLVMDQSIEPGEKVEMDEEITITVSTGAPKFEMPDVTDGSIDKVKKQLNEAGLVIYISYEQDKKKKEGTVLDQSIEAGKEVSASTEVTLTVSTKEDVVTVADVVGETVKTAKETLKGQGFNVIFSDINGDDVTDSVDEGLIVTAQLPSAESGQKEGSIIVLTVGETEQEETEETPEETEETPEETEEDKEIADENVTDLVDYLDSYDGMMDYLELVGAESTDGTYAYEADDGLVGFNLYEMDDGGTDFYITNFGSDSVSIFGIQFGDTREEIVNKVAQYGVYDSSWSESIYIITDEGIQIVLFLVFDDDGRLTHWTISPSEDTMHVYDFSMLEVERSYERSELQDWQLAYIQYIKDSGYIYTGFESVEYYIYALAHTSDDTIPALLQFTLSVNTNTACTYQDGEVVKTDIYGFPSYYNPDNNTIFFGITSYGAYQLREYHIEEDGSLTDVHYFYIEDYTSGDSSLYTYYVDGEEVSKETYNERLEEETSGNVTITAYKDNRAEIVDEICSYYMSE